MNAATEQRRQALVLANAARLPSAELRREVGALPYWEGRERLAQLVEQPHPALVVYPRLSLLLRSVNGVSRVRAARILAEAGIQHPSWSLGQLSDYQRRRLAKALRGPPQ